MKKTLLPLMVIALIAIVNTGYSQQMPLYSMYMMNDFYINPAVAGSKDFSPLILSVHKQWAGIDNSPHTETLTYHTMLPKKNMALGGILFNDGFGPESRLGLQFVYAYHFHLNRYNKISLGLAASATRYKLDERDLKLHDPNDPAITSQIEKTFVPDANFGVYFYGTSYYGGIAATNLFQSKLKINTNTKENKMVRHYFLSGGYIFEFKSNQDWLLEPSVMLKFTELTRPQVDINSKVYFRTFWFGVSVRPRDSFITSVGFKYKEYFMGFSYDFTFSDLSKYTFGSQEIIFGWNMNEKKSSKRKSFF